MKPQVSREHRWSSRQAAESGLRIYMNGQRSRAGRLRNLSIGGVFAEIDATALSPNAPVDVAFVFRQGEGASPHRLPARVIWVGNKGAGLMFTHFRQETMQVLRAALHRGLASTRLEDVV